VDDLADALVYLMQRFEPSRERTFVNVGVGEDVAIADLAALVKRVVGYGGGIRWNTAMPDGTPRKLLDVSALHALGWRAATPLEEGLRRTYAWFLENQDRVRR
jgi:GDP-L-fucose synthase